MLVPTLVVINEFVQNREMTGTPKFSVSSSESFPVAVSPLSQWVEVLSGTLHSINSGTAMHTVLEGIAEAACTLLGLDMCALLTADEREERLLVAGSHGLSPAYVQLVNGSRPISLLESGPTFSSPSAQAYHTRSLVVIPHASEASEFSPWRDMARDEGYESLIAAPLANQGPALGVLVGYGRRARRFTSEQIDGLELLARFASTALNTARLRATSRETIDELHRTNIELLDQQRLLSEQDIQHDELMRAVASNIGVAGVISTLARLLRIPVLLQDPFGTTLAEERLHCTESQLSVLRDFIRANRSRVVTVGDSSQYIGEIATTVRPILLDAQPVALLWVGPATFGNGPVSEQVLDRFALAVALELAKALPIEQARRSMARDVTTRLITAEDAQQREAAIKRAATLGLDPGATFHLVLFDRLTSAAESISSIEFLEARTTHTSYPVLIGGDDQRAVALIQSTAEIADSLIVDSLDHLKGIAPQGGARAVIASSTGGLRELDRLYRGLVGASALLPDSTAWTAVRVDLTGMSGLLLTHGSPESLRLFARSVLTPLRGREGKDDLAETLRVWLDSHCSVADAATVLHVHPNTVKYRLKNIEKLLGRDLKASDQLLEVRLAVDIERLIQARGLSPETDSSPES